MKTIDILNKLKNGQWTIRAALVKNAMEAQAAQEKGADLIVLYHTMSLGVPLIAGLMPFGNPNDIVMDMLSHIPPQELEIPIYAGVCGSEPFTRKEVFIQALRRYGVTGIQNFPTVGITDGVFRYNVEAINFGFEQEVSTIRSALVEKLDVLPYVFNQAEALQMARAGAKILIYHLEPVLKSQLRENLSKTLAKDLEKTSVLEKVIHTNYPDVKILVHSTSNEILDRLSPLLKSQTRINGIFRLKCLDDEWGEEG